MMTPESVWDYPRPPALEPANFELRIVAECPGAGGASHPGLRLARSARSAGPGQQSVAVSGDGDVVVASTTGGYRVLETSHPPVYYFPPDDIECSLLRDAPGSSFCEWKGSAAYHDLILPNGEVLERVAWSYPNPTERFAAIAGYLAFYIREPLACYVGEERAKPQPGGFYGGWVTSNLEGPFKGGPGTRGW